jgi:hypothetical protein
LPLTGGGAAGGRRCGPDNCRPRPENRRCGSGAWWGVQGMPWITPVGTAVIQCVCLATITWRFGGRLAATPLFPYMIARRAACVAADMTRTMPFWLVHDVLWLLLQGAAGEGVVAVLSTALSEANAQVGPVPSNPVNQGGGKLIQHGTWARYRSGRMRTMLSGRLRCVTRTMPPASTWQGGD